MKIVSWTLMKGQALELSPGASLQIVNATKPEQIYFHIANSSKKMIRVEVEKGDCRMDILGVSTGFFNDLSLIISTQEPGVATREHEAAPLAGEHEATSSFLD